jgi:WD40 repeat protein
MQAGACIYTASADTSLRCWDTATSTLLSSCTAHRNGVKSVSVMDACADIVATGRWQKQQQFLSIQPSRVEGHTGSSRTAAVGA